MADGIVGGRSWSSWGFGAVLAGMFSVAFKRTADQIAGAETDGERERENNSAEQDTEGQLDDLAANLEMVEGHGGRKHEHQPLHAERKEPRVLELRIHGSDEH
jgi:hypothetical protein